MDRRLGRAVCLQKRVTTNLKELNGTSPTIWHIIPQTYSLVENISSLPNKVVYACSIICRVD